MSSEPLRFEDFPPDYQAIELVLCRQKRTHYIQNYLYIKHPSGKIGPMQTLRKAQKKLAAVLTYCREHSLPARVLILKSRKLGISTYTVADCYAEVKEHGYDAILIAQDKETPKFMLEWLRRFIEFDQIDPLILKHSNRKEIAFKGREGFIEIHTANEAASTRSRSPQYVHASECAWWENGGEAGLALLNALGDEENTTLIQETTAHGEDGYFYPKWRNAYENSRLTFKENPDGSIEVESFEITNRRDWNGHIPLFISVLDDEKARQEFKDEAERTWFERSLDDREEKLIKNHGVSLEYLKWRRWVIKNKCNDDEDLFDQERPLTPEMAFLASGRPRFNVRNIIDMPTRDGILGRIEREDRWNRRISFKPDKGEFLTVFEPPIDGHRYAVGIDTAEGKLAEGGSRPDSSVLIVLDVDLKMQVATYCGPVSEEKLVEPALLIAEWYNGAFVNIETNSTGKHVDIQFRKRYPRERLFRAMDWDKQNRVHVKRTGWRTTSANRPTLIGAIASSIQDMGVILVDPRTKDECRHFVWKNSSQGGVRCEAAAHWHDDHVMSFGLALLALNGYPEHLLPLNREGSIFDEKFLRRNRLPERRKTRNRITGY